LEKVQVPQERKHRTVFIHYSIEVPTIIYTNRVLEASDVSQKDACTGTWLDRGPGKRKRLLHCPDGETQPSGLINVTNVRIKRAALTFARSKFWNAGIFFMALIEL